MKHLLNNLSEEEKNSIREQHTGGMEVMTENFSRLMNSKLGDSKPLVEQGFAGTIGSSIKRMPPGFINKQNGNSYKKPPYCKIGESQGTVTTSQTSLKGPDTNLGETGFSLSVNGKEVCLISTKYPGGGYYPPPGHVTQSTKK